MRDFFIVIHFIGLSMALGAGFSNMFLGSVAAKLEPAERGAFLGKTMILARMGQIGFGLLLISGFYLITPYWKVLPDMPTLIAKLTFVAILLVNIAYVSSMARKAKRENNPALLAKLKPFGMVIFAMGLIIVVLAVLTFH